MKHLKRVNQNLLKKRSNLNIFLHIYEKEKKLTLSSFIDERKQCMCF